MNQPKMTWIWLAVATLFIVFASACAETAMRYHGNKVATADVVAILEQGPHRNSWTTFDISIEYEYSQSGDTFKIAGEAVLGDHQRNIYHLLKNLSVYLFILDADSRVIETVSLVNALNEKTDASMNFDLLLHKPSSAAGISFGYTGYVCEYDNDPRRLHDGCLSFTQQPIRR